MLLTSVRFQKVATMKSKNFAQASSPAPQTPPPPLLLSM
jgi:hypothetical protein